MENFIFCAVLVEVLPGIMIGMYKNCLHSSLGEGYISVVPHSSPTIQLELFNPLSHCFEETTGFDK